MINCLIVDDEPLARQILESYVHRSSQLRLTGTCANAIEAFEVLSTTGVDLLLLDIKMPSISGTEFIRSLRNPPAVIFTTAYSEFAVLSYELNAIDYLVKPVTYERFTAAIAKVMKVKVPDAVPNRYSYFKINGRLEKLMHEEIIYARSLKDYICIHCENKKHIVHLTTKELESMLPSDSFLRIHRSYIINVQHIKSIGKDKISVSDSALPIGESFRPAVQQWKNKLI
jgi:two-component system LytT family response regulator